MTTRRGGARAKVRQDDRRGGARPNAGAPLRRIRLSKEDAQTLRVLTLARRALGSDVTEAGLVATLIRQAWNEYSEGLEG